MPKKNNEPQALQLCTLAGTFESSRAVIRCLPISTISTFTQLSRELVKLSKDKERVKVLFDALSKLDTESRVLGATTLVKPADHPLFTRSAYVPRDKE